MTKQVETEKTEASVFITPLGARVTVGEDGRWKCAGCGGKGTGVLAHDTQVNGSAQEHAEHCNNLPLPA
jgi:hypothetical protein